MRSCAGASGVKEDAVLISAKTGEGLDKLRNAILRTVSTGSKQLKLRVPYEKGGLLETIHKECKVLEAEYLDTGIEIKAICPTEMLHRYKEYAIGYNDEL